MPKKPPPVFTKEAREHAAREAEEFARGCAEGASGCAPEAATAAANNARLEAMMRIMQQLPEALSAILTPNVKSTTLAVEWSLNDVNYKPIRGLRVDLTMSGIDTEPKPARSKSRKAKPSKKAKAAS